MKKYLFLIAAFLFILTSIFWSNSQMGRFTEEDLVSVLTQNLSAEMGLVKKEAQTLKVNWSAASHPFFLIENNRITKWNRTTPFIEVKEIQDNFEWKLIHNFSSSHLVYKKKTSDSSFVVGVIPLRAGYRLTNQYLNTTWNEKIFPISELQIYPTNADEGGLVCVQDVGCLFRVKIGQQIRVTNSISVYLILIATILLIAFVYYLVRELVLARKYLKGFIALFFSLAALRIGMVSLSFPSIWMYSNYFDPRYFASSTFNASVADFFFNSLVVSIASVYLLFVYAKSTWLKRLIRASEYVRLSFSVLFLVGAFFSFLFPHLFVEAIFHDSSIVLDISKSVQFDGVKLFALGAYILSCISSFCFVHCFLAISNSILNLRKLSIALLFSSLIFIGYFVSSELDYWPVFVFASIYFPLVAALQLHKHLLKFKNKTLIYFLIATLFYSAMAAWDVRNFSDERTSKALLRSASSLIGNDELGEFLLDQAKIKIANDLFVVSSVENPLLSKMLVKQKISQIYLGDYFDRYDVGINLFLADGSPADAESKIDFASSIRAIQSTANKTNYESVYWIQTKSPRSLKRYVLIVPLVKNNSNLGYVVIDLNLKRVFTNRVYPELLSDNRFNQTGYNKEFSYALFNGHNILDQNGSIDFERDFRKEWLSDRSLYSKGVKSRTHLFVAEEDEVNRIVVLGAERSSVFNMISNFSFFFVIGIILILIVWFLSFNRRFVLRRSLSFSTRIQLFSYLSLVIPLVAISLISVRMIVNSNNVQFEKEVVSKGVLLTENLVPTLERARQDSALYGIKEIVVGTSQVTSIDANLYSSAGELITSSQPLIFSNQLLMPLINANALEKITSENLSTVRMSNKVGALEYNSSYFSVRSPKTGELLGILELPFFNPKDESTQASVVSNILVTFVFVFLFFSVFSFKVVSNLTAPLFFLAKKLSSTSFSSTQKVEWKSNDEIGELVKQYNQMLKNLEQSRLELARQEKENAWREIAKQVAHEIKNPLTPMKLTLQQLEQKLLTGDLQTDRTSAAVQTLLAQVNILDGIASSFSTFANMPLPQINNVDLVGVLERTVLLFQDHSLGSVNFNKPAFSLFVEIDERLLGRIISNIILNALQSNTERKVMVEVGVTIVADGFTTLYVKDNGIGISPELQNKIFLPHFTTKATGSGLGLAIAKQGVELMGGTIWFESTQGQGTCFFIKLKNR
jgi:two-component system, NtrC family, nitrogen regulation sensor histidine kinase NtrY